MGRIAMYQHSFKSPASMTLAGIVAGLLLVGCSKTGSLNNSIPPSQTVSGKSSEPSFSQFPDIPIPSAAEMDVGRTLVLGGGEHWLGRLVLKTENDANAMFNFYKRKMPERDWQEITSVRSSISVLTFSRGERVATIQIQSRTLQGSEVLLTMSPRERMTKPKSNAGTGAGTGAGAYKGAGRSTGSGVVLPALQRTGHRRRISRTVSGSKKSVVKLNPRS
jgi:hypothetical protein